MKPHPLILASKAIVAALGLLTALAGNAQSLFYLNSPLPSTTLHRTDGPYIVGNSFLVGDEPVVVDKLGVYDLGNDGFLSSPIEVGIWNEDGTTLLASASVSSTDPTSGGYRYHPLTGNVTLAADTIYLIGARIGGPIEPFLCADQADPLSLIVEDVRITRLETRWNLGDTLVAPVTVDGFNGRWGPANASLLITEPVAPQILIQPLGASRLQGDSVTLSATASGSPQPHYQWFKDETVPLTGATNNVLTLTNLLVADAGNYTMRATNIAGSVTTTPAQLSVVNPAVDITSDLRLWLKFDETSGLVAADHSGAGHAANLQGFPEDNSQWVAGRTGMAIQLASGAEVTNVVLVTDPGDLDFSSTMEFSLALWVKGSPAQKNSATLLVKGNGGTEQYALDEWDGNYRFYCRAGGGHTVLSTPVRPDGTWQHLVGVFSYSLNRFKLYVNGVEVASGIPTGQMFSNSHEVSIGSKQGGPEVYDNPFDGRIDDVRIYARALTPADVQQLLAQAPPLAPNIAIQPVGGEFYVCDTVALRVGAEGTQPLRYQWSKDGAPIADATNATLLLPAFQAINAGTYRVEVTNLLGKIVSSDAVITARPQNQGRLFSDILALGNRNNFSGTVGTRFAVGTSALNVTALGFEDADGSGFNSAHQIALWDTNGTLLASVTVPAGTAAPLEGAWRYATLPSPVALLSGTTYFVGAEVFDGDGDGFTDSTMPTP
ncbi:MAG TPA: LamG-like jellyroll fold domain-containing protein, partial [Clostridia bacterium]|nr:LamG-like jellyroll fold domain-containing protein [Clostridia bacterium]